MSEHGISSSIGFSSSSNTLVSGSKAESVATSDLSFSTKLSEATESFSKDHAPSRKEGNSGAQAGSSEVERTTSARDRSWSKTSDAQTSKPTDATKTEPNSKPANSRVKQNDGDRAERVAVQSEVRNSSLKERSEPEAEAASGEPAKPNSLPVNTIASDLHNSTVQPEGNIDTAGPVVTDGQTAVPIVPLAVTSDVKVAGWENAKAANDSRNAEDGLSDATLDGKNIKTAALEATGTSDASVGLMSASTAAASADGAIDAAEAQAYRAEAEQLSKARQAATDATAVRPVADSAASTATGAAVHVVTGTAAGSTDATAAGAAAHVVAGTTAGFTDTTAAGAAAHVVAGTTAGSTDTTGAGTAAHRRHWNYRWFYRGYWHRYCCPRRYWNDRWFCRGYCHRYCCPCRYWNYR